MSASEWLHIITPIIVILVILHILASIPVALLRERNIKQIFKTVFSKLAVTIYLFVTIGWLMSWISLHIHTYVIQANTLNIAELILILSLSILAIMFGIKFWRQHSLFTAITAFVMQGIFKITPTPETLIHITPHFLRLFSLSICGREEAKKEEQEAQEKEFEMFVNERNELSVGDINRH